MITDQEWELYAETQSKIDCAWYSWFVYGETYWFRYERERTEA